MGKHSYSIKTCEESSSGAVATSAVRWRSATRQWLRKPTIIRRTPSEAAQLSSMSTRSGCHVSACAPRIGRRPWAPPSACGRLQNLKAAPQNLGASCETQRLRSHAPATFPAGLRRGWASNWRLRAARKPQQSDPHVCCRQECRNRAGQAARSISAALRGMPAATWRWPLRTDAPFDFFLPFGGPLDTPLPFKQSARGHEARQTGDAREQAVRDHAADDATSGRRTWRRGLVD